MNARPNDGRRPPLQLVKRPEPLPRRPVLEAVSTVERLDLPAGYEAAVVRASLRVLAAINHGDLSVARGEGQRLLDVLCGTPGRGVRACGLTDGRVRRLVGASAAPPLPTDLRRR